MGFFEDLEKEFWALRNIIKEKGLQTSSLETRLEKVGKCYQEEVKDLKIDIVDLKERVLDTKIYNCKDTIILNNPPKLNGKSCVEVKVDFFNQSLIQTMHQLIWKLVIFWARLMSLWNLFTSVKKIYLEKRKGVERCVNPANRKSCFIVERLPKISRDIFQQSRALGFRTVTKNAQVQVICKNETGVTIFWPIWSSKNWTM